MRSRSSRLVLIDAFKAVASQLIVLHHLSFYGPMSDVAFPIAPSAISWFSEYGRVAVQVFLVIGGFLGAMRLAPDGVLAPSRPAQELGRRYLRLVVPYAVMLAFGMLAAALVRQSLEHESVPGVPSVAQVMSHLLLLHDLLGFEALSAGVWYVAIDFQLFALMLSVLWMVRLVVTAPARAAIIGPMLVIALAGGALFHFNRDPAWDNCAIYFFGSYAFGALAWWSGTRGKALIWIGVLCALAVLALMLEFRLRILVAATVAVSLAVAHGYGVSAGCSGSRLTAWLGRISYSVFLVHFPVCLLINALFARLAPVQPLLNVGGMVFAWLSSIAAGELFHRYVESRAGQIRLPGFLRGQPA